MITIIRDGQAIATTESLADLLPLYSAGEFKATDVAVAANGKSQPLPLALASVSAKAKPPQSKPRSAVFDFALLLLAALSCAAILFGTLHWVMERRLTAEYDAIDERQSVEYKAGFDDGYLLGKADAVAGRAPDGEKALRFAQLRHLGEKDLKGFENGYFEGWGQRDAYQREAYPKR